MQNPNEFSEAKLSRPKLFSRLTIFVHGQPKKAAVNHEKLIYFKLRAGLGTVGIVVGITLLTYLNFFDITKVKIIHFWMKNYGAF